MTKDFFGEVLEKIEKEVKEAKKKEEIEKIKMERTLEEAIRPLSRVTTLVYILKKKGILTDVDIDEYQSFSDALMKNLISFNMIIAEIMIKDEEGDFIDDLDEDGIKEYIKKTSDCINAGQWIIDNCCNEFFNLEEVESFKTVINQVIEIRTKLENNVKI